MARRATVQRAEGGPGSPAPSGSPGWAQRSDHPLYPRGPQRGADGGRAHWCLGGDVSPGRGAASLLGRGETGPPEGSIPRPPGAYNPRTSGGVKGLSVRWEEVFRGCCRHLSGTLGFSGLQARHLRLSQNVTRRVTELYILQNALPGPSLRLPRGTEGWWFKGLALFSAETQERVAWRLEQPGSLDLGSGEARRSPGTVRSGSLAPAFLRHLSADTSRPGKSATSLERHRLFFLYRFCRTLTELE